MDCCNFGKDKFWFNCNVALRKLNHRCFPVACIISIFTFPINALSFNYFFLVFFCLTHFSRSRVFSNSSHHVFFLVHVCKMLKPNPFRRRYYRRILKFNRMKTSARKTACFQFKNNLCAIVTSRGGLRQSKYDSFFNC